MKQKGTKTGTSKMRLVNRKSNGSIQENKKQKCKIKKRSDNDYK